jgi:hypothetical protein
VSDASHGKRGTVRLDPSATVPEAIPALRFADAADISARDRAELERQAEVERATDPRRKNDRKEFTSAAPVGRQPRPTVEMGTVDVSRADPRQAPTQQVSRLPLVDRGYDPSREEEPTPPPSRGPAVRVVLLLVMAAVVVAAYFALRRWL